jgi:hypothetical protein
MMSVLSSTNTISWFFFLFFSFYCDSSLKQQYIALLGQNIQMTSKLIFALTPSWCMHSTWKKYNIAEIKWSFKQQLLTRLFKNYVHISFTGLILPVLCLSQATTWISNVICRDLLLFSELRLEVMFRFVDICEFVDHHFLFISPM